MSGKPPSLQPLPPKNDSINTWCTSVCICLCIGGSPVPIQPPTESTSKANVATLNLVVTSPLSNRITTAVPSRTPTIINKSRSTSITCPETAGTCICLSVSVFTILPSNMLFLKCFPLLNQFLIILLTVFSPSFSVCSTSETHLSSSRTSKNL